MLTGSSLIQEINTCPVPPNHGAFWWLGQQSFIVKLGSDILYLDPFLTPLKSRNTPPLLRPDELTNATLILGSHDHLDHIDRRCWPAIAAASPSAKFVVPKLLRGTIVRDLNLPDDRVLGVDEGLTVRAGSVTITAVPAAHEFLDTDPATHLHPYVGFIIEGNGICLYHAGDSCLYEGMQAALRRWKLDLAFLPINGRDAKRYASNCIGNMTYQEAADLAGAIRPGLTVPAHFDMFTGNSENPQLFIDYMKVKYPHLATMIPQHSQRTLFTAKPAPSTPART
jgi:L-ascorbate metabolism protein UlaG (beta-lactamase superfamily)